MSAGSAQPPSTRGRLAVFAMQAQARSETFIKRHVCDLAPAQTVVVARLRSPGAPAPPYPLFVEESWSLGLSTRAACRVGFKRDALRDAAVARFLRENRVAVVLGEYLDQFVDFVPLLDRMGLPYVAQAHGLDVSSSLRTEGLAQRYLAYRSARAVLTRSELHRRRLIDLGLPERLVHLNAGGVDILPAIPERTPDAGFQFLAVGRMVPQKAPIKLLEAFRRAASVEPRLTLDFVGVGPLFSAVRQFVEACGLGAQVRLHGAATEAQKHALLQRCGVFVQHSETDPETGDEEGLPAAIQEAMGHGMAVVSTRHSGIVEAVVEGETGLLVDEGDIGAMAQAFASVPAIAADLGRAGHQRASEQYAWRHEQARLRGWLFGERALGPE